MSLAWQVDSFPMNHQGSPTNDVGTGKRTELADSMEKAMAPHSSTLAWKIPWMEQPGRLQSMGSLKVGHN